MDDIKRGSLLKQWNKIVDDLQVEHILDQLYSLGAVSTDDLEKIRNKRLRKDQATCLLNIISTKDNQTYDSFVNVLQKDYNWLFTALHDVSEDDHGRLEHDALQDALVLGDVPRRPPHYIERTAKLRDLQLHLGDLQPCQRIVLHGRTGSGKSSLAAAAVKDSSLLQRHFRNRVFWVNLGEIKVIDQLPAHMNLLLQRLTNDSREQSNKSPRPVSLSAAQTGDSFMEIQVLKDSLKNMFRNGSYREALLILDNVSLQQATEAFDVGCKTLITTQLKDIVIGNNTVYMEVKDGFTEEETLSLFANCLKTPMNTLPTQATTIHNLCKGEPILIALIGSLLEPSREDLLKNLGHWEYYIKKLKRDYNLKAQLFDAISISIERLKPELRGLYQCFAVFVEDVNITPEVMQTIWNMENVYDVQHTMIQLQNKSLIVSYYNQELNTYVYGIHDLFLAYLKEKLGATQLIEQHRKLISAYKRISNRNFANLPNDNYIFQYIGYHLKEAQLYDEFMIYFDLNFIGAKIKAIGTADLLRDFQVYKGYITRNDEALLTKLDDYINFVKTKGYDLFKYQNTDIIQCGLGENKEGAIYRTAIAIAKLNPRSLYLQMQAPQENVYFAYTLDLPDNVSAACFTADVNQVLVGLTNGDINLWEQAYNQKLFVFSGHTGSVTHLQLCPDGNGFLSVAVDGTVKVWTLKGFISQNSNGGIYGENGFSSNIPSPHVKQCNWTNFFGNNGRVDHSKTCRLDTDYSTDRLISASYANETENRIITGCHTGKILIWNIRNEEPEIVLEIAGRGQPASCVTFSGDDSLVIFSCETNIFLHDAQSGDFLSQFCNKVCINSLLIVPELDTTLIVINDSTITMWTWNQVGLKVMEPAVTEVDNRGQANFLCGAVTHDGLYLVAGSTDYFLRIWHIGTAKIVQEILHNKGLVVCLDTFYGTDKNAVHILLSGSDDKTVKQWHIQPTLQSKDTAKLLPIFDCFWNAMSGVPRIAVVNTLNKVQVMNGHNLIIESEKMRSPIKVVRFSLCGNKVALGLENGDIMEFDYKNRHYETLMKLHDSVVLLKYFNLAKDGGCPTNSRSDLTSDSFILVAAAQNGWVTIYKNGRAWCLIQPMPSNVTLKQVPVIPIVQCFYIRSANQLLSVSQNRTIKIWNIDDGSFTILFGDKILQNEVRNSTVTMATLSKDQSLMAVTMADGCFEIYSIFVNDTVITLILNQAKCLDSALRSCRFSCNGKILALGQDSGNIVIWSVESKIILGTLHLHKSWVRYLLFSPAPALILISVGEQIAWWDLTKLPNEGQSSDRKGFRRRSDSAKKKNLTIDITAKMSNLNLGLWSDKEGRPDKPHLLSAVKVRGLFSTYISASQDFTSFFTIDKNGYLYIMEMLKQNYA